MTDTLYGYLTQLHIAAGKPPLRRIGAAIGLSHTFVAAGLKGEDKSRWENIEKLVDHLGGDADHARRLWESTPPPFKPARVDVLGEILAELRAIHAIVERLTGHPPGFLTSAASTDLGASTTRSPSTDRASASATGHCPGAATNSAAPSVARTDPSSTDPR